MRRTRSWLAATAAATAIGLAWGASAGAATRPDHAAARTRFSLQLSSSAVVTGQQIDVLAAVHPKGAGRLLILQRRTTNRWRNLAARPTNRLGEVTFRLRFHKAGTVRLRALAMPDPTDPTEAVAVARVAVSPPYVAATGLTPGARGAAVLALQQRLSSLGYWVGSPDGYFGDATEQAIWAVQKAAGLPRSGVIDAPTALALEHGVVPVPRSKSGDVIEVNLERDLVMFVHNGQLRYTLNTSTGGGYTYVQDGVTNVASTPVGIFHVSRVVDGLVVDSLGSLWRPRFFYEGFALHGDNYVPPEPVSHGCVRVSDEAINWVWSTNLAPMGAEVWVY